MNTVDFFPPIVDDPYDFGAIAVANAISDVYAMGGTPILGLNLVCFPEDLSKDILHRILAGGADKASEAGLLIAGGHTITDKEPKYGMAVTGKVPCDGILTNANSKIGDHLILTKPIGTGVITTAGKASAVDEGLLSIAVQSMAQLNRLASEAALATGVNSCTDITGFGLIGHLMAMMKASGTSARISFSQVPVFSGVKSLVQQGIVPGGTHRNFESVGRQTNWEPGLEIEDQLIMCDAQTSGGLLLSVPEDKVTQMKEELISRNILAAEIGIVYGADDSPISVSP